MEKLLKIINKQKNKDLLKLKRTKKLINEINSDFKPYDLKFKVNNLKDYFEACIMDTSLKQKQFIENAYEENRNEYIDVWNEMDNLSRQKFFNNYFLDKRKELHYFYDDDKIILITFLDPLFNALYDHEQVDFELPQFFKLFKDFKKYLYQGYGLKPYENGFVKEKFLMNYHDFIILYDDEINNVYIIKDTIEVIKFNDLKDIDQLKLIMEAYIDNDVKKMYHLLLESNIISDKIKKKLEKKKVRYE